MKINETTGTTGSPGTKGYTGFMPSEKYAKYKSELARIIKKTTGYEMVDLEPVVMDTIDVKDNEINQVVATAVIESEGYCVDVAKNGVEAIAMLTQSKRGSEAYKIIFMDCQMPEMDGFEATRLIREGEAGERYKTIPIIAMTANAMQSDKEKCMKTGMDDFLAKPIKHEEVIFTLKNWLSK